MIRLSELKLPLDAVPFEQRRAADAPAETDADRQLPPHPIDALRALPGVGPKSAQRMAYHLMQHDREGAALIARAMSQAVRLATARR